MANLVTSGVALSRSRVAVYWAATILVAAELGLGGVWDVSGTPLVRGVVIDRLGYPTYFLVILGVWKLLGSVVLLIPRFPRLKEWAYAGAFFTYTGAVASHLSVGDFPAGELVLLIVMTGLTFVSWALRPPARRDVSSSWPKG